MGVDGGYGQSGGSVMAKNIGCFGVMIVLIILMSGCVYMSSEYSDLLDRTAALSQETALRATQGTLSQPEMVNALNLQAATWQRFRDARDRKE